MTHPIPDAALDADIAILGKKGGGKTYTSKGIVERLLDMGRRVLVLDPLGVWAGLRTSADGDGPGYPVAIFGGPHADMPLDTAAAVAMADVLARENVPAVIDLSELTKGAQQAFLLAFLHELRRVNIDALTLVLEEADVFAPQNPQGDDSKQLHHEIDWIARRGRFKGFRLITICQRPARLSKDVLTQAATLVAHKLPAPQDRDAVKAWVEGNGDRDEARAVFDTLGRLEVGEAWVWASEQGTLERRRFPVIKTLDTSATPKAGEKRIEPKRLADVDVSAIRAALASAQTPATKPAQNIPENMQAQLEAAEQRGLEHGFLAGMKTGFQHAHETAWLMIKNTAADLERTSARYEIIPEAQADWRERYMLPALEKHARSRSGKTTSFGPVTAGSSPAPAAKPKGSGGEPANIVVIDTLSSLLQADDELTPALQRALDSIAWWHWVGLTEVPRARAAITAGLSPTASTFGVYVGKLSERGLVEASSPGQIRATDIGLGKAKFSKELSVLDSARSLLDGQPARVFDLIVAAYPNSIGRGELADQMSLSRTASTLGVYLGKVSRLGLVETLPRSMVRAADFLFTEKSQ